MTAKRPKNTSENKDLGAIQRDHPNCDSMARKPRPEYHLAYDRKRRARQRIDPTFQAAKSASDRWEKDSSRATHCVYLANGSAGWGNIRDLPSGAVTLLEGIDWCAARAIGCALKRTINSDPPSEG